MPFLFSLNLTGVSKVGWASGNFDDASTIDLTDLSDVLNNFSFSRAGDAAGTSSAVAEATEPAFFGLFGVAGLLLLKRRRGS